MFVSGIDVNQFSLAIANGDRFVGILDNPFEQAQFLDPVVAGFGETAHPFFALAHLLFGTLAIGDVGNGTDAVLNVTLAIAHH